MKNLVSILFLGVVVAVSSKSLEKDAIKENAVVPEPPIVSRVLPDKGDSESNGSKDELEGAESAYLGFPYYYPYVYKYPVILYGK